MLRDRPPWEILSFKLYLGTILPGKSLVASPITGPLALSTALLSPNLEELRRANGGGKAEEG